jgi:NAD(P)-dependent dehydrogenase (short-subunit alcohol dehydrogenase family)
VRNVTAGDQTAADITESTGDAAVHVGPLDLADQASVAGFARSWSGPVDVLINNAGVMALPDLELSPEGWVMQFATNHMGHFTLALALHDALAAAGNARIVSLTSRGHLRSPVIFDDVNFAHRAYDPWLAYGQSKTANVLFAVEATRRWAGDRITANAVHPGAIAETNVATSTLVATSPMLEGVGGRYFEDCNEARVIDFNGSDEPTSGGRSLRSRSGQHRAPLEALSRVARNGLEDVHVAQGS